MACRPRRDRAGAWCGSGPGALRRHLDRAVRWYWTTRDRSRRASV